MATLNDSLSHYRHYHRSLEILKETITATEKSLTPDPVEKSSRRSTRESTKTKSGRSTRQEKWVKSNVFT